LAGRWQAALASERLAPGDRVAVLAQNSVQWACFDIAALGLGLVVVTLYTTDSAGNIAYILGDSGTRLLLVGSVAQWNSLAPLRAEFPALERVLCLDGDAPEALPASVAPAAVAPSASSAPASAHRVGQRTIVTSGHRPPQGRHAVAREHPGQCRGSPYPSLGLPRGRLPVLPAAVARVRAHRGLLRADDGRQLRGVCPFGAVAA
jgi:hypothetical protein